MRRLTLALGFAGALLLSASAFAGDCYSVRVQGCGKKARVCVATSSSSNAETKAVDWFKKDKGCTSASVTSYSSSCSEAANDKCDVKL
jgi:hypothetical protein